MLEGDPREVIARAAREEAADLVVVGRGHHSALETRLLGTTAETVCRRAASPVLLVP